MPLQKSLEVFTGVIKNISPVKGLGFIVCRESEVVFGRDVIVSREHLVRFSEGFRALVCKIESRLSLKSRASSIQPKTIMGLAVWSE